MLHVWKQTMPKLWFYSRFWEHNFAPSADRRCTRFLWSWSFSGFISRIYRTSLQLISVIIALQNGTKSCGTRAVMVLRSQTTGVSSQSPPAFSTSSLIPTKLVHFTPDRTLFGNEVLGHQGNRRGVKRRRWIWHIMCFSVWTVLHRESRGRSVREQPRIRARQSRWQIKIAPWPRSRPRVHGKLQPRPRRITFCSWSKKSSFTILEITPNSMQRIQHDSQYEFVFNWITKKLPPSNTEFSERNRLRSQELSELGRHSLFANRDERYEMNFFESHQSALMPLRK